MLRHPVQHRTDQSLLSSELAILAEQLNRDSWLAGFPQVEALDDLHLARVNQDLARRLQFAYHYLRSSRVDGINVGLYVRDNPSIPACLLTFVPFDLPHLLSLLPNSIEPEQVVVLARVVTMGPTAKNLWSYAFGQSCDWLANRYPSTRLILTYNDPNAGFRGSSYRAANWVRIGDEPKERYVFLDGLHITNRSLVSRFGTADFDELAHLLGHRICRSTSPLIPLQLFGYFVRRSDRRRYTHIQDATGSS